MATVSKFCISIINHTITLSYILPPGSSSVLKVYRQYPKISCPHSHSLAHVVMAAIYMFLCINQPLAYVHGLFDRDFDLTVWQFSQ